MSNFCINEDNKCPDDLRNPVRVFGKEQYKNQREKTAIKWSKIGSDINCDKGKLLFRE